MSKNDVAKIKANVRRYVAACNAGDAAAFQQTLARDVIFMPPDAPKLKGDKATAAWIKQTYFDPFLNKLGVKFDSLKVIGTQAFGSGSFTIEMTPKVGGSTLKGKGKYFNVFKKQKDGSWKYSQGIWNFDKPPA
jgi:ketosteroid isomerase-like protein